MSKMASQMGYFEHILAYFCRLFASTVLDAILDTYGEVRRHRAGPHYSLGMLDSGQFWQGVQHGEHHLLDDAPDILRASPPAAGPPPIDGFIYLLID